MNGKIIVNLTRNWHPGIPHVRGAMFDGTKKLSPDESQSAIRVLNDREAVTNFLKKSNGFFSVVNVEGNNGWIAVDRIRSLPLFYGQHNGKLFISDDARWVREHVHDNEMDPIAREEFLACGYVTGSDTLFPNVKQVQAGEAVFFEVGNNEEISIQPQRYFQYYPSDFLDEPKETLFRRFETTLGRVFQRLIDYAEGRTLVVPLSGGYDSRLIAVMLKRLGYDKFLAFSYGKPGNTEAQISKSVAEKLNINWVFIPYTNELWHDWYLSPEMKAYFEYADGLASLPHIQDWPAVLELKAQELIPENSVFVPGHTPVLSIQINKIESIWGRRKSPNCFFEMLRQAHYNLVPSGYDLLKARNSWYLHKFPMNTKEEVLGVSDLWAWTERQSKFIGNSVRSYEFFGYDWWMPFWDVEFTEVYEKVPYKHRLDKKLYKEYVDQLFTNIAEKPFEKPQGLSLQHFQINTEKAIMKIIKPVAKRILPDMAKKYLRKKANLYGFKKHPLQWYGIHNDKYIRELIKNGAININSIIVLDYLDYLRNYEESTEFTALKIPGLESS